MATIRHRLKSYRHFGTNSSHFSAGKDTSLAKMAAISDDEIIDSIENNQLKLIKERGGDLTIFSPKASAMGQHQADLKTSIAWARESNNLIHRVCELFPKTSPPGAGRRRRVSHWILQSTSFVAV